MRVNIYLQGHQRL